jgi:hypothetical protein
MNIRHALGRMTGIAVAATGLAALGMTGVASASTSQASAAAATNGPLTCTIQTYNGHYLTAVGGGGRTTDVIHTDATRVGSWEKFTLVDSGDGAANIHYGLLTTNGHWLTAVGGGGRTTDVIHSNATVLQAWEKFNFVPLSPGGGSAFWAAIQTIDGHYLTAVNSGGIGSSPEAIHSNATQIQAWERFFFSCAF